mmetsp:Transcript_20350/g.36366  ORF Transcript_20350/g.36366 Transcript_20350/m.36366 type:complete len:604 (+) Transcript_20350:48-1859(+)
MSAYTAAYAPPPPQGGYGGASASRAPAAFSPPGAPAAGSKLGVPSHPSSQDYASWPAVDQLVAAVPVRPHSFQHPPQKVDVGDRPGISELRGSVAKPFVSGEEAEFFLLKGVLTHNEAAQLVSSCSKVLSELIGSGKGREPDATDGKPSFSAEMVHGGQLAENEETPAALRPVVEGALLPYIRKKFRCPTAALSSARFRRFLPEERRFVPAHHEHDAFAVATVALQDPDSFAGGLFVQGSSRAFLDRRFIPMGRGDMCIFQHDLHHGVEVQEGTRLELVLRFKDSPQAVAYGSSPWYLKAAQDGNASAQYGWALSCAAGKDFQTAKLWLEKACSQDHPEALFVSAEWAWEPPAKSGATQDPSEALQLWRRAAELGHGRSQARLGALLIHGMQGRVQQDSWEGKRLLRLAFEQDDPDAAFHLGQALLQDSDRDGATKILAASLKGHARACFQVAEMYREGQYSFPQDIPQSLRYTKWAAHQGDAQALSNLGHLIINGIGVVRDDAKAVRLFRQAAKLGAAEGMLNYGLALLRGNGGVKVDYQEALEWAQKSAALGHSLAHQQLSMFFNAAKKSESACAVRAFFQRGAAAAWGPRSSGFVALRRC